jgi:predicted TIM-barrel fold metal-dependent hydrolase
MKDGMFVLDAVVHAFDFRPSNQRNEWATKQAEWIAMLGKAWSSEKTPVNPRLSPTVLDDPSEAVELFQNSDTDMAMAQTVPLLHYWQEGLSPADLQAEFAASMPDRMLFCGGVDPLMQGVRGAVTEMERQAKELKAVSFKFYQAQSRHLVWQADDRHLVYPLYEKALELGINFIQFHKAGVHGDGNVEDLRSLDIQRAAIDFPELTFGLHHLGDPYLDETFAVASRHENVVLVLPLWFNLYMIQPRRMVEVLGKALFEIGADRLLYGSEAFIWPRVQTYIDAFAELEMPQDLQDGWGYPAMTREMKEKIFGLNLARILGIDVESKKASLNGQSNGSVPAGAVQAVGPA